MLGKILVGIVAFLHVVFLVLEMFLWTTAIGMKIFKQTAEQAQASAVLAMNQGLYNGFLAAGLVWGLWSGKRDVSLFFLICVVIAGIFGGLTAKVSILFIQALPGLLALIAVFWHGRQTSNPAQ